MIEKLNYITLKFFKAKKQYIKLQSILNARLASVANFNLFRKLG